MKISYNTVESNKNKKSTGYSNAGSNIISSLESLGHQVSIDDPSSDIQFYFSQPNYFSPFDPSKYNITYTPWESSLLPKGWVERFNAADEVWTTSQVCADWFVENGVKSTPRVYQHGIEDFWTPRLRGRGNKVKFLHIGEPAQRKGGQIALEAFLASFMGRRDVSLTIKAHTHNTTRVYAGGRPEVVRSIHCLPDDLVNIKVLTGEMSEDELLALYWSHDVLLYPSWGEGFGFIPLQALATGMPTICTSAWAPYKDYLGSLALDSRVAASPWPQIHPGQMFEPSLEHMIDLMKSAVENITSYGQEYFDNAGAVHDAYNWKSLTREAFSHLEQRESVILHR